MGNTGYFSEVSKCVPRVQERPEKQIPLQALHVNTEQFVRKTCDPTPDLITITPGPAAKLPSTATQNGFVVWCSDTKETWYAPTQRCLDNNFIYREDLVILPCGDLSAAEKFVKSVNADVQPGVITRKSCYLMDDPASGCYEVYYNPSYPASHYGKDTPTGHTIWKYPNRFYRDMAILELDTLYSETSKSAAKEFVTRQLSVNEAIVISDGAWISGVSCYAFVYIDGESVCRISEGCKPSDPVQAVLISEINGAYEGLLRCISKGKNVVTYYYDNASVVSALNSTRLDSVSEINRFKQLCDDFTSNGGTLNLIQIHPKTGDDRDEMNKAIKFFHMLCDKECRTTADICSKEYVTNAVTAERVGASYNQVVRKPRKTKIRSKKERV